MLCASCDFPSFSSMPPPVGGHSHTQRRDFSKLYETIKLLAVLASVARLGQRLAPPNPVRPLRQPKDLLCVLPHRMHHGLEPQSEPVVAHTPIRRRRGGVCAGFGIYQRKLRDVPQPQMAGDDRVSVELHLVHGVEGVIGTTSNRGLVVRNDERAVGPRVDAVRFARQQHAVHPHAELPRRRRIDVVDDVELPKP